MTKHKPGFRTGTRGACEATLYEFTLRQAGTTTRETVLRRVAAASFQEAVQHVAADPTGQEVVCVHAVGMVEMVSGSPLG